MAAIFSGGLRALRAPALSLCRTQFAAPSIRRSLATSAPRYASAAQTASVSNASQTVSAVENPKDELTPFKTLKGKVSPETLEAITVRPMKHTHMTVVQEAVLSMLPELATPLGKGDDGHYKDSKTTRDLMVRAKTGTGKTLAFLVPAIESRVKHIEEAGKNAAAHAGKASDERLEHSAKRLFAHNTVGALILSPTRELAKQIAVEAERLSTHHGFKVHQFLGGESKSHQLREWKHGRKDIVVATTGRFRDIMESAPDVRTRLSTVKMLILDEADTMLDMGFRDDIEAITAELPPAPDRQTFVFSATISKAIQQIARQTMSKNHIYINTVSEEDSPVHAHVPQYHTVLPSAGDQLPHTLRLIAHDQLSNPGKSKVIVFLPTTKLTQLYSTLLRELARAVLPAGRDTTVYELHSKRSMESRTKTSDRFRKDESGACVLITSDVSARGVDYPGVTRVIQLGIPASPEQYVHRVGRTGRTGGMQGRGDLVLLPWEHSYIRDQLDHVPLKPITANDLAKQVSEIAVRHDEDPDAFFPKVVAKPKPTFDRRQAYARGPVSRYSGKVVSRIERIAQEVDEVLSSAISEDEVKETFASMLGFYVGRSSELRLSREALLEGLREWAVQAGGLPEPPYVSEAFLQKLGFSGDKRRRPSDDRNRYSSNDGRSRSFDSGRNRSFDSGRSRSFDNRGSRSFDEGRSRSFDEGGSRSFGDRKRHSSDDEERSSSTPLRYEKKVNRWDQRGSAESRRRRAHEDRELKQVWKGRGSDEGSSQNEWPPRRGSGDDRRSSRRDD